MGHRTTHKPGRMKKDKGLPSPMFLLFAAVGIVLLIWIIYLVSSRPMKPPLSERTPVAAQTLPA